jgi:hypothetical protein
MEALIIASSGSTDRILRRSNAAGLMVKAPFVIFPSPS